MQYIYQIFSIRFDKFKNIKPSGKINIIPEDDEEIDKLTEEFEKENINGEKKIKLDKEKGGNKEIKNNKNKKTSKSVDKKMKEFHINSRINMKMKLSNFKHSIGNQVLIVT